MTTTTSASLRPLRAPYITVRGAYGIRDDKPISGDMVLKIRPPALQNVLKIPLEGAFLAQWRINAPPNQQHAASIGVGIDKNIQYAGKIGVFAAGEIGYDFILQRLRIPPSIRTY